MPKWISVEKAVIKYHIEKEASDNERIKLVLNIQFSFQ